jgi:hypothetical protein
MYAKLKTNMYEKQKNNNKKCTKKKKKYKHKKEKIRNCKCHLYATVGIFIFKKVLFATLNFSSFSKMYNL